ncbi:hypothetical protein XH97_01750 [Bradyrhizobium sp. CCBAU 53380]|nr:hypothetical protein [Bradyrhizobium sp. CCBAU 53380]
MVHAHALREVVRRQSALDHGDDLLFVPLRDPVVLPLLRDDLFVTLRLQAQRRLELACGRYLALLADERGHRPHADRLEPGSPRSHMMPANAAAP